jgi:hypothetical protein
MAKGDAKIDVRNIIRAHRRSYVKADSGEPRRKDKVLIEWVPALVGAACLAGDVRLSHETANGLLTVSFLLSALLFGVMLQVADRAMSWADEAPDRGRATSAQATFLEELSANAGYASLVSIVAALLFVGASVSEGWALRIFTALGIGVGVHLVFVLLMVMKRLFALTQEQLNRARTTTTDRKRPPGQRAS